MLLSLGFIFFFIIRGCCIAWYNNKSEQLKQLLKLHISSTFFIIILFFRQCYSGHQEKILLQDIFWEMFGIRNCISVEGKGVQCPYW